jgi:gamma-glutamylputrescine oxidase
MATHLRPYWTSRLPESRKPRFAAHRSRVDADVVIVGGGLIGCTSALLFASAGIRTVLVEAKRVGEQSAARQPGIILAEPSALLTALDATNGRRRARVLWEMYRGAAGDFVALLGRLGIRCDLHAADAFHYLSTDDDVRALERERDLRRAIEVDGQWLLGARATARLRAAVPAAIRVKGASLFDPYRACLGLARAAVGQGARVFEKSPVTRIRHAAGGIEVVTKGGTVAASRVVVATGGPGRLFPPLARRFNSLVTYRVVTPPLSASLRRQLPESSLVLREATCPGHAMRWTPDRRLLFGGIERVRLPERSRPAALAQHSAQLMDELGMLYPGLSGLEPDYAWDAVVSASGDGSPYIGPHRHYPRHLFALGAGRADAGAAFLAAEVLLRYHQGIADKHDALVGFGR